MLVKASIAGAIVTNTLFMLGASLLLGGLKYHVQEFNRANARLQAALLFLATVALLIPTVAGGPPGPAIWDSDHDRAAHHDCSWTAPRTGCSI
jgi:calcium/proton exchanger cax